MGLFKDDDGKGYLLTEDVSALCAPYPFPGAELKSSSENTACALSGFPTTT